MRYRVILLIVALFLSGCGFHLRHNFSDLGKKYPAMALPMSGSHTFHQALYRSLSAASIELYEQAPKDTPMPELKVTTQVLTQHPLVYGPDAELRRERLKLMVAFSFSTGTLREFTISTERDRQLNSNQHLGDNAEKIIIEREMQADVIDQLLRLLATEGT